MIHRAILATDLSKCSDLLMECIPEFKILGISHITLLHVPTISFNYMEYSGYSMMVHIEARMINMKNKLIQNGIAADFIFREGLPSQEILDYAANHPEALLIIGSKGHGFHKRNLIGSTTLRVIQYSKNPVLMIRIKNLGKDAAGEHHCSLESKKITGYGIILTDFSRHASGAFFYARDYLAEHMDQIAIMHVQDKIVMRHHDPATIERFNKIDSERLRNCSMSLRRKTKAPVQTVLVEGAVVPEIIREVKEDAATLLIMGTHGKGYFSDIVLGSTTSAVVQLVEANCLLVPTPGEETEQED
ncbi:MAG: universal stress protein [Bacteroidales bacterium]